jgi:hypothetical protein
MADAYLTTEDWTVLAQAAERAKRGLRAYLSADQGERLKARGYMAPTTRDPTQLIITPSGRAALVGWQHSRKR